MRTLNPPATDAELDVLRAAIEPYDLPEDLEMLYRWHNGQDDTGHYYTHWPVLEAGPLLDAVAAARQTEQSRRIRELPSQWSTTWVAITHLSWQVTAVELAEPLQGLVIDASLPDPPRAQADSLAAVVEATCKMIEAGVPLQAPTISGPDAAEQDRERYQSELTDWARSRHEVLNPVPGLAVPYLRQLYYPSR